MSKLGDKINRIIYTEDSIKKPDKKYAIKNIEALVNCGVMAGIVLFIFGIFLAILKSN